MAGIYVHIPFCKQSCYYCDFHFSTSLKTVERVIHSIKKEIALQKNYLSNQKIETIYFGGGTPSLLESGLIHGILQEIYRTFNISTEIELTIEANPEDITIAKINEWLRMGINRVSIGIQSFRNQDLLYMNRVHDSNQSMLALQLLLDSEISNVSVDLIYGMPELEDSDWAENLQLLIELNVKHIACYSLTVEKNTPLFHFIQKGKYQPLSSQKSRAQFLLARKKLIQAGYQHYEISNFSKEGFRSKHNSNYWNKTFYLGLGPAAHSYNGKSRQWNIKNNTIYCNSIDKNKTHYTIEHLTEKNIFNERILTKLRTSDGLLLSVCSESMSNSEFKNFIFEVHKLEEKSLLRIENGAILLTESGMLLADSISEQLFLI